MGKYRSNSRNQAGPVRSQVPPLLRGIGCISFVVVPVLSYFIADAWVTNRMPLTNFIPPDWPATIQFPAYLHSRFLDVIISPLERIQHLQANLVFALAFTIIITGLMSVVYGYVYAMFGPSKYGPTDVPPPRVKPKSYKR